MQTALAYMIDEIDMDRDINATENIKRGLEHIVRPIVLGTLIFLFLSRAIVPSYDDIMYYWMITVLEFTKHTIALLTMIAYFTAMVGTFLYNVTMRNMEYRHIMVVAHITIGVAVLTTLMLVTRVSKEILGINDVFFAFFTDAALEVLFIAFISMPTLVLQTKIVPK